MAENLLISVLLVKGRAYDFPDPVTNLIRAFHKADPAHVAEFRERCNRMKYSEFLETLYWDIIRAQASTFYGYKCNKCLSERSLQVHHRAYDIKGVEFDHIEDLELLCGQCHKRRHGLATQEDIDQITRRAKSNLRDRELNAYARGPSRFRTAASIVREQLQIHSKNSGLRWQL